MRLLFYLILGSLLFCACQPFSKYHATFNPDQIGRLQNQRGTNSQGNLYTYRVQRKVILLPEEVKSQPVVVTTIDYLQKIETQKLARFLRKHPSSDPYLPFARGLLALELMNYTQAYEHFKQSSVETIQPMVDILLVDCAYEVALARKDRSGKIEFVYHYQLLQDKYEFTGDYLKLLNNRVKFVLYEI